MARLIDADKLEKEMYHEAFETDSDLQKWDSGCWIRYRMFKDCIAKQPTVDAVELVRCEECKHYEEISTGYGYCYNWDYEAGMSPNQVYSDDFCSHAAKMDGGDKE